MFCVDSDRLAPAKLYWRTKAENHAYADFSQLLRWSSMFSEGGWRRDRDSNPGYLAVYTLSKRAPSATRPSLRGIGDSFESNTFRHLPRRAADIAKPHGACAAIFCFTIADAFRSTGAPCIRYRRSVEGSPQLICHPRSIATRMYCPGRTLARS